MRSYTDMRRMLCSVLAAVLLLSCLFCGMHAMCCADENCALCGCIRRMTQFAPVLAVSACLYGLMNAARNAAERSDRSLPVRFDSLLLQDTRLND